MLTAGSTHLVFHLLCLCAQLLAFIVSAPTLVGIEDSVSDYPHLADGIEQDMNVSCSSFEDSLSQDEAEQFPLPPLPRIARIYSHMSIYCSSSCWISINQTSWFKIQLNLDPSGRWKHSFSPSLGVGPSHWTQKCRRSCDAAFL